MNFAFIYFLIIVVSQSAFAKSVLKNFPFLFTNLWIEPEDGLISFPGLSANLTCLTHSTNHVFFEWARDGVSLRHSSLPGPSGISVHSQENHWPYYSVLKFYRLGPSHSGIYKCSAIDTRLFDQRSASVEVLVSDSFDQLSHRRLPRKERDSLILLIILISLFLAGLLLLCMVTVRVAKTAK